MANIEDIGIEQARASLGDLANLAKYTGQITYLTRHGRRVAVIAPIAVIEQGLAAPADDEPTHTAAIGTRDSEYCDVTVLADLITGYDTDDDGNETPRTSLGDPVTDTWNLPVRADDTDRLDKVEDRAAKILAANGWLVSGPWEVADNALYAPVEKI